MSKFSEYRKLVEESTKTYSSGTGYTARVIKTKSGKHTAKFFKNGEYMQSADYEHDDPKEVHDFAKEEMKVRSVSEELNERIKEPQGHKKSGDPISKDTDEGSGPKKKMMGNRTPLEIIAKILAGDE